MLWTEKYRPYRIEQLIGQDKFANDLQTKYTKVFNKYLEDRGSVELVHNFTFENLRFYK